MVSDYTRYLYRSSHRAFPGQVGCHLSVLTNTSQPGFLGCSRDIYDTGFHKLLLPFPLRAPLLSGKEQPRDEKSPAKRVIDAVAVVQIAPRREPAQRRREPCVHCCSMSTSIDFQITMKDLRSNNGWSPLYPRSCLYTRRRVFPCECFRIAVKIIDQLDLARSPSFIHVVETQLYVSTIDGRCDKKHKCIGSTTPTTGHQAGSVSSHPRMSAPSTCVSQLGVQGIICVRAVQSMKSPHYRSVLRHACRGH